MKAISRRRIAAFAAVTVLAAGVARAEIVQITGEFPAQYREASFLTSLHIERFNGEDGPTLALAVERALTGSTSFDIISGRTGRDTAEGSMSGVVTTGVEQTPYRQTEKKCVERDANKKCTKEVEVQTPCQRRVINVNAEVRLVRNTDGRVVYSKSLPFRDETSWCQGQNPSSTVEETVTRAIGGIAQNVRLDIAPHVETYRIRLRESTKGMPKDMANAFKGLIKSSQRDLASACTQWAGMNQALPGNPSITFDLGLCAEARGDYVGALAFYQQAAQAGASEGREGAGRAQQLIAGRQDAAERARRR